MSIENSDSDESYRPQDDQDVSDSEITCLLLKVIVMRVMIRVA